MYSRRNDELFSRRACGRKQSVQPFRRRNRSESLTQRPTVQFHPTILDWMLAPALTWAFCTISIQPNIISDRSRISLCPVNFEKTHVHDDTTLETNTGADHDTRSDRHVGSDARGGVNGRGRVDENVSCEGVGGISTRNTNHTGTEYDVGRL